MNQIENEPIKFSVQHLKWNSTVKSIILSLAASAFILMIPLYLFMYPVKHAPGEIQTAWYILIVPGWVSKFFITGILGFILFWILQKILLLKIDGYLHFASDKIIFNSPRYNLEIKQKILKSILFVPKKNLFTQNEIYRLTFITRRMPSRIYFRLKNEDEFENLLSQLTNLDEKIKIKAEPDDMVDIFDD